MFGFSCVGEQRNHILYSESPTAKKVPLWSYAASIRGGIKGWNHGSQKQYLTISFMSIIYLLTSQEKNQLALQRK